MLLHIWRNQNGGFHPLSGELSFVLLKYAFNYWDHMALVMAWMNEHGAQMEYWQGRTEVLGEKLVQLPLHPPPTASGGD